jgi:HK97 family phage prohead protease
MNRCYSVLTVKSVQEDQRIIRGTATTPEPDRMGDIVEPLGVQFKNPMPLLWQHRSDKPVGTVKFDKPTKAGITFEAKLANITEPGALKDRIDEAWQSVKAGLVSAVSIGFNALEYAFLDSGGVRFIKSEVMELSLVTIPANAGATISQIKSIDTGLRAALGIRDSSGDRPVPPGASGKSSNPNRQEAKMKTSEKIAALEARRTECIKAWEGLKDLETKTAEQKAQIKQYRQEVDDLDEEIDDEKAFEKTLAVGAKPVKAANTEEGTAARPFVPAVAKKQDEPGIAFTRLLKVKAVSRLEMLPTLEVAAKMYGKDSQTYSIITKTNEVLPGTAASGNWAYDLISQEGAALADFVEWLRAGMIVGKFGQNGIPALRRIGFYQPYATQTAGGTGAWVGEAKPKPLTSFDFDRSTLTPLKMAIISVLSERNIRYSDPNSDVIIRDQLGQAIIQLEDETFIASGNSGTSNIKPASITNGAAAIVASGTGDADDIRLDIRALVHKFTGTPSFNPPRNGVLIMSTDNAMALGTMTNALGQPEFPGIGMDGGRLLGFPIIVSDYAGSIVALVNASDIYYADEGGVTVDFSREASLEMKDDGHLSQDAAAGTGASLVSMFQNNMVAYRAEKTVNWKRRRTTAVAYLSSVAWGGAVPLS